MCRCSRAVFAVVFEVTGVVCTCVTNQDRTLLNNMSCSAMRTTFVNLVSIIVAAATTVSFEKLIAYCEMLLLWSVESRCCVPAHGACFAGVSV